MPASRRNTDKGPHSLPNPIDAESPVGLRGDDKTFASPTSPREFVRTFNSAYTGTLQSTLTLRDHPEAFQPHAPTSTMLKVHLKFAVPTMVSTILRFSIQTIQMAYVGHRLGADALAAISVAFSVFSILAASTSEGLLSALDTLAPQAYGRDVNTKQLSVLLQRAFLIMGVVMVGPLTLLFVFCDPIVESIYSKDVGSHAAKALHLMPLFMIPLWCTIVFAKLCRGQQLAELPPMANACGAVTCVLINYFNLPQGAPLSEAVFNLVVSQLVALLVIILATQRLSSDPIMSLHMASSWIC